MLWIVGPVATDYRHYLAENNIPFGQFPASEKIFAQEYYSLDFSSPKSIVASLQDIPDSIEVTGVMMTGLEQFVLPAAIISDYFNTLGIPLNAARAATDKIIMRAKFEASDPAISPPFCEVNSWDDIEAFYAKYGGSVMLKPANLMKSLFVSKNSSLEELRKNYDQMLLGLPNLYTQNFLKKPRIIIERYMPGSMHTVAGFVDRNGDAKLIERVADCLTARDVGIDDSFLFERILPSGLPQERQEELFRVTRSGIAALGLKNTPIHAELIYTEEGAKIIEIGARNGGFRPRMYDQAYGIDLIAGSINCAMGHAIDIRELRHDTSAVIELFPTKDGVFKEIDGIEILEKLPSLQELKVKAAKGQHIGKASSGYRAAAVANLAGYEPQVVADKATIMNQVSVTVH